MLDLYTFSFISVLKKVVKYMQIILLRCQCMQTIYAFNYDFLSKKKPSNIVGFFLAENFLKIKDTKALELLNGIKVCVNLRYLGVWLFNNEIDFLNCWYSLEKRPNNKLSRVKHRTFERFIRGRVTRIT